MKKTIKKTFAFTMAALMLSTSITACGSDASSKSEATTAIVSEKTTTSAEATTAASGAEVTTAASTQEEAGTTTASNSDASSTAPAAKTAEEKEYAAQVNTIYTEIKDATKKNNKKVKSQELDAAIKVKKELLAAVKPLYEKLAAVTAPESMKSTQTIIADGANASVEILNLIIETFEIANTKDLKESDTKKIEKINIQKDELQKKADAMTETLNTLKTQE